MFNVVGRGELVDHPTLTVCVGSVSHRVDVDEPIPVIDGIHYSIVSNPYPPNIFSAFELAAPGGSRIGGK
jgi:hypothetical protein